MTHIGIICPALPGHLNPMTTLGYELKERGHRVTLIGIADAQPKAIAAGLEFPRQELPSCFHFTGSFKFCV